MFACLVATAATIARPGESAGEASVCVCVCVEIGPMVCRIRVTTDVQQHMMILSGVERTFCQFICSNPIWPFKTVMCVFALHIATASPFPRPTVFTYCVRLFLRIHTRWRPRSNCIYTSSHARISNKGDGDGVGVKVGVWRVDGSWTNNNNKFTEHNCHIKSNK